MATVGIDLRSRPRRALRHAAHGVGRRDRPGRHRRVGRPAGTARHWLKRRRTRAMHPASTAAWTRTAQVRIRPLPTTRSWVGTNHPASYRCPTLSTHVFERELQVTDEAEPMGPISYLIVEFPGNKMTGEGFPALIDLVDRGVIRILDLEFVTCRDDGSVEAIELRELETQGHFDLKIFEGASSGMLDQSDFDDASKALRPGSSAGILIFENRWATTFVDALRRGGGELVAGGLHPAGGHRRLARRNRGRLIRQTTDEKGRGHATTAQRCRPHGGGRRNGDRGLQPRLATPGQSLDATERSPGVRAAAAVRPRRRRRSTPSRRSTRSLLRRLPLPLIRSTSSRSWPSSRTRGSSPTPSSRRRRRNPLRPRSPAVRTCCSCTARGRRGCRSPAAQPHPAGRLQPTAAGEVRFDSPVAPAVPAARHDPAEPSEGARTSSTGRACSTDAEFESAKAKLLAR